MNSSHKIPHKELPEWARRPRKKKKSPLTSIRRTAAGGAGARNIHRVNGNNMVKALAKKKKHGVRGRPKPKLGAEAVRKFPSSVKRREAYLGGREALVHAVHSPIKPPFWGDKPPSMFQEDEDKKLSRVSEKSYRKELQETKELAKTDPDAAHMLANMEMVLPAHPWTATTDEEDSKDLTLTDLELSNRRRARALHRVMDVGKPSVIVHDPMFLRIDKAHLPLAMFDSEEMFERHSPQQWLRLSKGRGFSPFQQSGQTAPEWVPCDVTAFNEDTLKYTIIFKHNGYTKRVGRLRLRFLGEDQELFESRLAHCKARRDGQIAATRWEHFLKLEKDTDITPIQQSWVQGILTRAAFSSEDMANQTKAFKSVKEIADQYIRGMQTFRTRNRIENDPAFAKRHRLLGLPSFSERPPYPLYGKLQLPSAARFASVNRTIRRRHLFARKLVVELLLWLNDLWYGSYRTASVFLKPGASKVYTLQEFEEQQVKHMATQQHILSLTWRRSIIERLVDSLQEKYDLFQKNFANYLDSRLYKILRSFNLRMTHQLDALFKNSVKDWVHMFGSRLQPSLGRGYSGLFHVQLEVSTNKAGKHCIGFEPSPAEFESLLLRGLRRLVDIMMVFHVVDTKIMAIMSIPETPLLDLQNGNPIFAEADNMLTDAAVQLKQTVALGMEGPEQLAAKFGELLYVLDIDTEAFVAEQLMSDIDIARMKRAERRAQREANGEDSEEESSEDEWVEGDDIYIPNPARLKELRAKIQEFFSMRDKAAELSFHEEYFGLFVVSTKELKKVITTKAMEIANALMEGIASSVRANALAVTKEYEEILSVITPRAQNENELAELTAYVATVPGKVKVLAKRVDYNDQHLETLKDYQFNLSREDFVLSWRTVEWPRTIGERLAETEYDLDIDKRRMQEQLDREKDRFQSSLGGLVARVKEFATMGSWDEMDVLCEKAFALDRELHDAIRQAADFNAREHIFGWTVTEYDILKKLKDDFAPFINLWQMTGDFVTKRQLWLLGPFLKLDGRGMEKDVMKWWAESYKLKRRLERISPKASKVAGRLREEVTEFKQNLAIVIALASKALDRRHWEMLSDVVASKTEAEGVEKVQLIPDEELTLKQLVEMDIQRYWEDIEDICMRAEKEYRLKQSLSSMQTEWDDIDLDLLPHKNSGTYVLKGVDDVGTLLDDQIVKVQTMLGSSYVKWIEKPCKRWEFKLKNTQDLLDEWLKTQRTWMYLEPIFASEDIMRQMPTEGRRFAVVDRFWKRVMSETKDNPSVMGLKESLLASFQETNQLLDKIQKGLADYLEIKRMVFPRFFFLSNDELLEILSQTKDPYRVQPHLRKCFMGITKVLFVSGKGFEAEESKAEGEGEGEEEEEAEDAGIAVVKKKKVDQNLAVTQMISSEGEHVDLIEYIYPSKGANRGNVERWMVQLQQSMRVSVKAITQEAIEAYPNTKRTDFILQFPGMSIISVSSLYWTQEVTEALKAGGDALPKALEVQNGQIADIVKLVRGKLSKMNRTSIGALCVIDVHARDVVFDMVAKGKARGAPLEAESFDWMSQLRYYYEDHPDDYDRYGKDPMNMVPRIVNAEVLYGYEYLGNSSRLVITPLTDRCYRTMIGAVALMYGGAPAGPAGTGKTETVKDLSKAVAIQCVVFNCSDGLDFRAMGKFFKGLAASGAWACFDEFNRIELEVLSVIAEQLMTILKAKRLRLKRFTFEQAELPLNPDCNSFITMNPGYAGRTELPDNLKALYRPCAMMVPDYAQIAEIKLYSFGFEDARSLARKAVQVLQLCSEQLSSQKHYDYGMRAVFSILIRAGHLRQTLGDAWTEATIVLSAITDVNLPKFTTNDIPLFKGITSDLFPGVKVPKPDYGPLIPSIRKVCDQFNLQKQENFLVSVVQLYETVMVRHGLMVVGQTMAAKTSIIHTLARAMTRIKGNPLFTKTRIHTMNPKAITQGQLYGAFDLDTHEWSDGVLAVIYRRCARDESPNRDWILFDGPVDAVWIENMNTVLDDNKKLCMTSGEILAMSNGMTMVFETEDLEEASPATVSRVGMVFVEQEDLGWRPLLQSWCKEDLPEYLTNEDNGKKQNKSKKAAPKPPAAAAAKPAEGGKKDEGKKEAGKEAEAKTEGGDKATEEEATEDVAEVEEEQPAIYETNPNVAEIYRLFKWMFLPCYRFLMKQCKIPARVTMMECARSSLNVLYVLLVNLERVWVSEKAFRQKDNQFKALEGCVVMAMLWSVGVATDTEGRVKFNDFLRRLMTAQVGDDVFFLSFAKKYPRWTEENPDWCSAVGVNKYPDDLDLYSMMFDNKDRKWVTWKKFEIEFNKNANIEEKPFSIGADTPFNEILVPTIDVVRNGWWIKQLLKHEFNPLCGGQTGTAKTVIIKDLLVKLDRKENMLIMMNYSAQTSANMSQDIIDGKLSKRRKGVFGPPLGKHCIIFVDDINMPKKEIYGAQPPIEILRQCLCQGGWFDRSSNTFRSIVDANFICAMGPPGGGRTLVTQRFTRHFNLIYFVPFDEESLTVIFSTIFDSFLQAFPSGLRRISPNIVASTIQLYTLIRKELLPTPRKIHYTYNLRDIGKVFQGLLCTAPPAIQDNRDLVRLFGHETLRVFHDRLIDDFDRQWFHETLNTVIGTQFAKMKSCSNWKELAGSQTLLYGNFVDPRAATKVYQEIKEHEAIQKTVEEALMDYNNFFPKKMDLVLFLNAIEHIARISRIIHQSRGNALLVGVGGSGRKSLTRLASFMGDYQVFSIEISKVYGMAEWRDDLKSVFKMAGVDGKPTVFLLSDTQIKIETFVEDVNNILNTGEVPNLFLRDELMDINESLRAVGKQEGKTLATEDDLYQYLIARCRANLHVVLAFSPIGDAFRTRLLMFPALINCCAIDWFTEWPDEALRSVAVQFLAKIEIPPATKQGVVDICVSMQESVFKLTQRFESELRRYYYVTPTSYLTLIGTFLGMVTKQRKLVTDAKGRYDNGLNKLRETEELVAQFQVELELLGPKLKVAQKNTDDMLIKIEKMTIEANKVKETVSAKQKVTAAQEADALKIKTECEADLEVALPAFNSAIKALNTLSKADITEVKNFKTPPGGVVLTMESICIMLRVAPNKVPNPTGGKPRKIDDYWGPAKKHVLGDFNFLKRLLNYDKDNMDPHVIHKVSKYTDNPAFEPKVIEKQSRAAAGLCKWVHAMVTYDRVARVVAPKRAALAVAETELAQAQEALEEVLEELRAVENQLAELQKQLQATEQKKTDLVNEVTQCEARLVRADKLLTGLGGEKGRWVEKSKLLGEKYLNVVGDSLLSSGVIAYLGAFPKLFRTDSVDKWKSLLSEKDISRTKGFTLVEILGEPVKIREWTICKLPNDDFSIDNAIMLFASEKFPLMIDPQGQANAWIRALVGSALKIIKQTDKNLVRTIENGVQFGHSVLLENVPEEIDPVLESVFLKQVVKQGGVNAIRIGDNYVDYDPNFRLFVTTKLSNPHYPPETCVMVNLLNFMATQDGLQDQMLSILLSHEKKELEERRETLILEDAANKKQLKDIEDMILTMLADSEGSILDNQELIDQLAISKVTSDQINEQVKTADKLRAHISKVREEFSPVAFRVSQLFFCIAELSSVDPMYQYSLDFYIYLFTLAIGNSTKANDVKQRCQNLNKTFVRILYDNICRSLFEKDKLLLSFQLCTKIMLTEGGLSAPHLKYFLNGNTALKVEDKNPGGRSGWLTSEAWKNLVGLFPLKDFEEFRNVFIAKLRSWRGVIEGSDPLAGIQEIVDTLEGETKTNLQDSFKQLMILRCLRMDKVVNGIQHFIKVNIGEQFILSPPLDLRACYEDSDCATPLVFVLSPGTAPMEMLLKLAEEMRMGGRKLFSVSLGQGQGPIAENAIMEAVDKGTWVCLQNCHLSSSWMGTLERLCEGITPDNTHAAFRLWLTSMPSPDFPVSILQNAVKMTVEPPKGMRANLQGNYLSTTDEWFDECTLPQVLRKLYFGLCFFHATVRERRKYGALGWNIPYEFSDSDLSISGRQLKIFVNEHEEASSIPYAALKYLVAQCNYGGRVTDDKDRRLIVTLIEDFYTPDIMDDSYRFSESGTYFAPKTGKDKVEHVLEHVRSLPVNEEPEVFEMHANANISTAIASTLEILSVALSLQPRTNDDSGSSWEETLDGLCKDIEKRLPAPFDIERIVVDYPITYSNSMNTVLTQELMRFNKLTGAVRSSLVEMRRSIVGEVVMSQELEKLGNSMVTGKVPDLWHSVGYPSLKPLGSWVSDLISRLAFLSRWVKNGAPNTFWISGFFFTQAFLTGTRQNFARKYTIPIDEVEWDFEILKEYQQPTTSDTEAASDALPKPEDGAYCYGWFVEGANWDNTEMFLVESNPKELFVGMPVIWLKPARIVEDKAKKHVYMCPVYKTSERRGMLSTTGHSTNFVIMAQLPMAPADQERHWIKRGVAMLTQLDS